jgi:outer membrane protein OmpA-like peptidoglycan-associated protein
VTLATASAAFTMLAWARRARADAIRLQFLTTVRAGERPKLVLHVEEDVEAVSVELASADGQRVTSRLGPLGKGARKEIRLPGEPGRRRYEGRITIRRRGTAREAPLSLEAVVARPLTVEIDRGSFDRQARTVKARLGNTPTKVQISLFPATGGAPLWQGEQDLAGHAAGEWVTVAWPAPPVAAGDVARVDLRFHDADGAWNGVSLFPWSVEIPHEEVGFATGSATIPSSEIGKLESSQRLVTEALRKYGSLGPVKLFIAGHTDTVGGAAYNVALSQRRARAIAGWFARRGLALPIYYEGFGEHALAVRTPDETAEAKNRRVDYILAIEEPSLTAAGFRAAWKRAP